MRLFIAIEMPEPARGELVKLVERLAATGEGVKWVGPQNLHLTLKFLGEAPEAKLPDIEAGLGRAVRGVAPIEAAVRGVGGYPSLGHPRVIWVGLEEGPEKALFSLAERVEREIEPLGFPREKREWSAHVTLGRVREDRRRRGARPGRREQVGAALAAALEREATFEGGTVRLDRVTLIESQLRPSGPIYTARYQASLEG